MESLSAVVLDGGHGSHARLPTKTISMVQMLLLNAVVCGIEIVACAGFTYIPPMLLKAGYSEENVGFLLGMGPLFGFLLVPIIGRASDRCYSPFGRRRPFIVALAIMLVFSLYLIPFGEYFASLVVGVSALSKKIGFISLTVGVVLLDFTTQASLTPCEALLNDASKDSEQNEKIFTVYSLMISSGGILGYALTAIDWTSTPLGEYFGGQEATIFSVLIIVFTSMLSATLMVAKEVPLSMVPVDISTISSTNHHSVPKQVIAHESGYESSGNSSEEGLPFSEQGILRGSRGRGYSESVDLRLRPLKRYCSLVTSYCFTKSRFLNNLVTCLRWLGRQLLPQQLVQLFKVPLVLKMLALADYCAWTAIMGFNIYYTDYVGQVVYGGNPNAPPMSVEGRAYDEGVRVASWGLLLHCICSAVFSFFIERLTESYGYKTTFSLGMVSFVFSMMGMVLIRHIYFVNLMAAVTGFAYSTITTIPFMLVSKYHADKKIYFADLPPALLCDTERGIGSDIAVLDWSYFLSQVIMTAAMGTIVHITGTIVSYMVTAGAMGILSIYYIGKIIENEQQARRCITSKSNQHIRFL
ncbi:solute carrier family 45 member 3 [Biomphalaria pfeifferi]|uniref:Solute carrier family 45 member 3 n=1 Tax=Biomphalaria pfeifferi TaxID=112525 RepID=A0AAD8F424_BIOPF|nr:solute carrier family 45 member 3 [Biomphalaria pfeifferi]